MSCTVHCSQEWVGARQTNSKAARQDGCIQEVPNSMSRCRGWSFQVEVVNNGALYVVHRRGHPPKQG